MTGRHRSFGHAPVRWLVLGGLLAAVQLRTTVAHATTPQQVEARPGGYSTQPASYGTNGKAGVRDLRATLNVVMRKGDTHYLSGTLYVGSASARTAVTAVVACRTPGSPHRLDNVLGRSESSENVTAHRAQDAVFINHDAEAYGEIYVLKGSVMIDALGPLVAAAQAYTQSQTEVKDRVDTGVITHYVVPSSVSRLDIIGDVEVTNCVGGYGVCPNEAVRDATVTSQLIVIQLASNGQVCAQTVDTRVATTVSAVTHHFKIYHRVGHVTVQAGCAVRQVDAYVRVWYASGNTVAVENHAETNTFLFNH
jgi:hypothetical protein